jgi:organic hydroperoxide reductase OsmC/OhrA
MSTRHDYTASIAWTGNRGEATQRYRGYDRSWRITLARGADLARADALQGEVHPYCFIARSVNFPVSDEASYVEA